VRLPTGALHRCGDPDFTPIDPIAERAEPNLQIENVV